MHIAQDDACGTCLTLRTTRQPAGQLLQPAPAPAPAKTSHPHPRSHAALSTRPLYSPSLSPYLTLPRRGIRRLAFSLPQSSSPSDLTSSLFSSKPHTSPHSNNLTHQPQPTPVSFLVSFSLPSTIDRSHLPPLPPRLSPKSPNAQHTPQVQPRLSFPDRSLCCACPSSSNGTAAGCLCFIPAAFIHNRPQRRRLRTPAPRTTSRRLPPLVVSQSSPHTLHPRPHSNHLHLGLASHHSCRSCGHPSCGPVYSEPS